MIVFKTMSSSPSSVFRIVITAFLICITFTGYAQLTETYYGDTSHKDGGVNDYIKESPYIIIGGKSFDAYKYKPYVRKIDTLGNTIWNTSTNPSITANGYVNRLFSFTPGEVIAFAYVGTTWEIWKINSSDGSFIWRKTLTGGKPYDADNYKDNSFLVSYAPSNSGACYIAQINNVDGNTIVSRTVANSVNYFNQLEMAVDTSYYTYVAVDYKLIKLDSIDFSTTKWSVNSTTPYQQILQKLHVDTVTNSLYVFGRKNHFPEVNRGVVFQVNLTTGAKIWETYTQYLYDVQYRDMKIKNGYIYTTFQHIYVGSGTYVYLTNKLDMTTGTQQWQTGYHLNGIGSPGSHSGNGQSAHSLDLDNNDNIYLTGYYGDANYGPECWGILKLRGTDGQMLYETTITETPTSYNNTSVGRIACVINNKPYFIGELEVTHDNYYEKAATAFIKIDPATGTVLLKKFIGGTYQFPSKTIQIEKYTNNKTIVFKQVGRFVQLEMYDANKSLLWTKSFSKSYFLTAGNLIVSPNGTIVFSAYSYSESSSSPYYQNTITSAVYVFFVDASGNTLNERSFSDGTYNTTPVELVSDDTYTFLFYQRSNNVYFRKINSTSISSEYNLNISYTRIPSRTKYCVDYSSDSLLVFGYKSTQCKMISINKSTVVMKDVAVIPVIYKIHYVQQVGSNIYLGGSDSPGYDKIICYNPSLKDTVWTKQYDVSAQTYKFCFDTPLSYIYAIGKKGGDICIKKVNAATGEKIWSSYYNNPENLTDEPSDILYDSFRDRILVTGYQSAKVATITNKNVWIQILEANGTIVDTYIKTGAFNGDNFATSCLLLNDASIWIGGNLNHASLNLAGFIYEYYTTIVSSVSSQNNHTNSFTTEVFPNPFTEHFFVRLNNPVPNQPAELYLFSAEGTCVYSALYKEGFTQDILVEIQKKLEPGLYLLQVRMNEQIYTTKIIRNK